MFHSVVLSEAAGANATKDESKDPENITSAMPCQGVLPKLLLSSYLRKVFPIEKCFLPESNSAKLLPEQS